MTLRGDAMHSSKLIAKKQNVPDEGKTLGGRHED
jgi:hypothetical protein